MDYEWVLFSKELPQENSYCDVTTEPFKGLRELHERWWFGNSRIEEWKQAKVIAWRKSLSHFPYEGRINLTEGESV